MSIESLNTDLDRLEHDLRELSNDTGRLLGDAAGQGRMLKEEVLAAEFLANEETMENVGGMLDALVTLADIQRQQLRDLLADHRTTAQALLQIRTPLDLLSVGFEHWGRRATHALDGLGQTVNVLGNEARSMAETLVEVWSPFIELMRRDWRNGDRTGLRASREVS